MPQIDFTCFGIKPDVTFLLDCDVATSLSRLKGRAGDSSRYDEKAAAFHEKVRRGFLELQKSFAARIVVLDAAREPAQVLSQALEQLETRALY